MHANFCVVTEIYLFPESKTNAREFLCGYGNIFISRIENEIFPMEERLQNLRGQFVSGGECLRCIA